MRKRPHRSASALLLLAVGAPLCCQAVCCQPGYPLAPTACDDWCFATQRAGCEEDYPEGCVSDCEDSAVGRREPRCEAPWLALRDCYRAAPGSDFRCLEGQSRPGPICTAERVALADCVSPLAGRCLESCLREVGECAELERDCEAECASPAPGCDAARNALYACRLSQPVDCHPPGPDARTSEQIPCYGEVLELLHCAGLGAGDTAPAEASDPTEASRLKFAVPEH